MWNVYVVLYPSLIYMYLVYYSIICTWPISFTWFSLSCIVCILWCINVLKSYFNMLRKSFIFQIFDISKYSKYFLCHEIKILASVRLWSCNGDRSYRALATLQGGGNLTSATEVVGEEFTSKFFFWLYLFFYV